MTRDKIYQDSSGRPPRRYRVELQRVLAAGFGHRAGRSPAPLSAGAARRSAALLSGAALVWVSRRKTLRSDAFHRVSGSTGPGLGCCGAVASAVTENEQLIRHQHILGFGLAASAAFQIDFFSRNIFGVLPPRRRKDRLSWGIGRQRISRRAPPALPVATELVLKVISSIGPMLKETTLHIHTYKRFRRSRGTPSCTPSTRAPCFTVDVSRLASSMAARDTIPVPEAWDQARELLSPAREMRAMTFIDRLPSGRPLGVRRRHKDAARCSQVKKR